jgi:hypothetical protein
MSQVALERRRRNMFLEAKVPLKTYELLLIASTRVLLGVGIGLLVADELRSQTRNNLGRTLLGIGLLSTLPLAADVLIKAGAFRQQFEDTTGIRGEGRRRNEQMQAAGVW